MNEIEAKLAALLDRAAGEPPVTLNADAITAHRKPGRHYLAPALAAVVVAVIAVVVAFASGARSAHHPASHTTTAPLNQPDPKAAAIRRVHAAVGSAPLPPGARRAVHALPAGELSTSGSPNEVRASASWTAPGTVDSVAQYVASHPPQSMTLDSSGSGSSVRFYDFTTKSAGQQRLEIDYGIASYGTGVSIHIDAWTVWAPIRPQWSYIPDTLTSVDVSIVRLPRATGTGTPPGAPTVQRTLTGEAAQRLAATLDALPAVAPEGAHSCPLQLIEATDRATFHTPGGDIEITRYGGGCTFNASITATQHPLANTFINGGTFDTFLLNAVGLPANYGYSR